MSMISITFFFIIGCTMISCSATSSNEITFSWISSWLRTLVVDQYSCSTSNYGLRTKTTFVIRSTISRSSAGRKMVMRIQKSKTLKTAWTEMTIGWNLSIRTESLLPVSMETRTEIATATTASTMTSMQISMRLNLYFENTSFSSLLLIVFSKSLISFSPK